MLISQRKLIYVGFIFAILNAYVISEYAYVASMFRHGARSPYKYKPGSENEDVFGNIWNSPPSQLTSIGERQEYLLGVKQSIKYKDFINEAYSASEMEAFATNKSRTVLSLQAQIQGLFRKGNSLKETEKEKAFPPGDISQDILDSANNLGDFSLPNNIAISPFTIYTPESNKYSYIPNICKNFPPYGNEDNEVVRKYILKFNEDYGDVLKKQNIHIDVNNPAASRVEMWMFFDTYITNYFEGNNLDKLFTDKEDQKKFLHYVEQYSVNDLAFGTYSQNNSYYSKLNKSEFFRELLANMKFRIAGKTGYTEANPKMSLYSLHDVDLIQTIVFIQAAYDSVFEFTVPYASFINFELILNSNNQYEVNIVYNDKILFSDPFDKFEEKITNTLLSKEEIDQECGFNLNSNVTKEKESEDSSTDDITYTRYIVAIIVMSIIAFILLILVLILKFRKRRNINNLLLDERLSISQ